MTQTWSEGNTLRKVVVEEPVGHSEGPKLLGDNRCKCGTH